MRLLKLEGDGSISLTEDRFEEIPPYAILSHTWGADNQEVSFQDVQRQKYQHKGGYKKLRFCGEQAALDHIDYFWVDTCCIDKSSSAELSEAINSMFRWYQNAAECYVYLSDVSKDDCDDKETSCAPWEIALRRSRWFTRGWTLQELIAPRSVTFFSVDGQQLGDKSSLETLLHEITGIHIGALRGKSLPSFSIEERLSWKEGRSTKRPEDRVYSLLGIFNIHLPLIYGEGEENAFIRLHDELCKRIQARNNTVQTEQPLGLRIRQEGSSFGSKITLIDSASLDQGNTMSGIIQGEVLQQGSGFNGEVTSSEEAKMSQGNRINGRIQC